MLSVLQRMREGDIRGRQGPEHGRPKPWVSGNRPGSRLGLSDEPRRTRLWHVRRGPALCHDRYLFVYRDDSRGRRDRIGIVDALD